MTLKKTDLAKQMALKLDSKRKAALTPERYGKQSASASAAAPSTQRGALPAAAPKLIAMTCRLPAPLVQQLREIALTHSGGIHAIMSDALSQWLSESTVQPKPPQAPARSTSRKAAS